MDDASSPLPSPASIPFTTTTPTTSISATSRMTSTTLLAVVIPLLLVVSLLLVGVLALYVRRRRASAQAEDRWAWRRTLGAGRADGQSAMWTGGWEREKTPKGWAWSPGGHHSNDKSQDSSTVTPPATGRTTSKTCWKALPAFPAESKRISTHYSPPDGALHRTASPPTLDVYFTHREPFADGSSSLVSFPTHGLESPFHLPALASLASLSAASSSTMSPPRRPGHPEPTFSPSSSCGTTASPVVYIGQRGAMSTQPSTETFEALTPSSTVAQVHLPASPKRTLARSSSSPLSAYDSPVVDIVRGGVANHRRWDSARNHRNVEDDIPPQITTSGLCDTSPLKILPRSKSAGPSDTLASVLASTVVPPTSFRPSASAPIHSGSTRKREYTRDSGIYTAKPSGSNTLSAAATAQLAALSFSLSQLPPAFLAHPPPSTRPSSMATDEPAETPEERRRRLATPRPDTGGDPCQVVKMFGLPREGENCLRGGLELRPVSRAGSLAGRAGELLGLGLAKKGGSRPSSRASSRSAVSSVGVDVELRQEDEARARKMAGGSEGGKRKSRSGGAKKAKKVADGPRPDTAGDPCGVQADIEWARIARGDVF